MTTRRLSRQATLIATLAAALWACDDGDSGGADDSGVGRDMNVGAGGMGGTGGTPGMGGEPGVGGDGGGMGGTPGVGGEPGAGGDGGMGGGPGVGGVPGVGGDGGMGGVPGVGGDGGMGGVPGVGGDGGMGGEPGVGGAGGMGGEPGVGGAGGMGGEPGVGGMGGAPPLACADAPNLIDFFAEAEVNEDGVYSVALDVHSSDGLPASECGGLRSGQVFALRAPETAYWLVSSDTLATDYDSVLSLWDDCPAVGTELTCADDSDGFGGLLAQELEAGEVVYAVARPYAGAPATLDLRALPLMLVGVGEPCSFDARQACAGDVLCNADVEAGEATCALRSPPEILEARALRDAETGVVGLWVRGRDASRDVVAIGLELLDADREPIVYDVQTGDTILYANLGETLLGQTDFIARRLAGLEDFPEAVGVSLFLVDQQDLESPRVEIDFVPQPEADGACDARGVLDRCPGAQRCYAAEGAEQGTCAAIDVPVVEQARAYLDRTNRTLGIEVSGTDANADLIALRYAFVDGNQNLVEVGGNDIFDVEFDSLTYNDGTFVGAVSGSVDGPGLERAQSLVVLVFDGTLEGSETRIVPFEAPAEVADGEACDPKLGLDRCPPGLACVAEGDETICGDPASVDACVEGSDVIDVNPQRAGVGRWQLAGATFTAFDEDAGSCVAGLAGVQTHVFTAPSNGTYRVTIDAPFDAWVIARDVCRYGGARFERACQAPGDGPFDLELSAMDTVYLMIGGQPVDRAADLAGYKRSRGAYTLTIERQ